jgi:hypothetical protein
MNNCRINEISIKLVIQIIFSIVRVSEHFSKMLVLSGVFNTSILDATNYANQDYACQLHTYNCLHYALNSNRQPIKKRLMFLPGYGPIAIADWSIIVQCHLLVTWVLAYIGAVVEMGVLSTLKRLLMES